MMLEPIVSFDGLAEDWTRLALQTGSIFSTWEWNSLWWKYFGRGRELMATVCRDDGGNLVAILPLYGSRERPLRILRFLGHGQGDHLGPICAPADRDQVAQALHDALGSRRFDLFIGDKMPSEPGWNALLRGRMLRRTASPVLRFEGRSWDELLASRSANFREQVRRRERKLAREHKLEYRFCDDPAQLQSYLDVLFRLHLARWGDRGAWFSPEAEAFHREFASLAFQRGWLRLWLLELDGRPAAAWYGLRFGRVELYYQAGRDPEWERGSVGFVLLAHSIRAAIEDGMDEYWFLEGSESFKYRFASDDPGLETIAIPRSLRGRAAVAAAAALGRGGLVSKLGRRIAG
jgi:CelD/BcsL family acetyltransferase involved in cellulose biosynthesis